LLHPNTYNPNRMSEEDFRRLVGEVVHLGRIPKPIVVRPDGEQYEIVEGEHSWKAANHGGLRELPCEVIDAAGL
jgi:ParB-like chromosome segregation protein Spo0J